jgi:hypothetical protein
MSRPPTACRYYPVALLSMRKQDEYVDRIPTPSSRKSTASATTSRAA